MSGLTIAHDEPFGNWYRELYGAFAAAVGPAHLVTVVTTDERERTSITVGQVVTAQPRKVRIAGHDAWIFYTDVAEYGVVTIAEEAA